MSADPAGAPRHNFLNDHWEFDTGGERWRCMRPTDDHRSTPLGDGVPFPRYTPVFLSMREELFLFGGYTEDRLGKRKLNDLWLGAGGQWQQLAITSRPGYDAAANWPGLRYGSMSAADDKGHVYVCGGFSDEGDHIDLWCFNMAKRQWQLLHPDANSPMVPQPRYCAAFASYGSKLFLFGGRSRRYPKLNFSDLWSFDLESGAWVQLHGNTPVHCYNAQAQSPGYHAKASTAVVGSHWYIWGGEGAHGHVSDFWRFDFESLDWQMISEARSDDPRFW